MGGLLDSIGIEPQLLVTQIIGFLILLAVLNQFMFKPLFGILDKRQQDIKDAYDQMDADRKKMEDARQEYEKRLAGIEVEARERIQSAIKEAQTLRDELLAEARTKAEDIVVKGREDNDRERERLFLELRHQIVGLAIGAAGQVIGESLTSERNTRLVDDYITSVSRGSVTARDGGSLKPTVSTSETERGSAE
jgi:F-type H+-transporting ATPase subunit b